MTSVTDLALAQQGDRFTMPNTPAGATFAQFIAAYNTGERTTLSSFVERNYKESTYLRSRVDSWLDLYYRYGQAVPYSINIDKDYDLEVWLRGVESNAWFAVEFILDENTNLVRAVGILQGETPEGYVADRLEISELEGYIRDYLDRISDADLFAGTVLVSRNGQEVVAAASGLADRSKQRPMEVDTPLNLASLTKMFTAVSVMQLQEKRLLSIDQPIAKYIPEYPAAIGQKVTIRHLLNHTSGIEFDHIGAFNDAKSQGAIGVDLLEAHLQHVDSLLVDGEYSLPGVYNYSNEGFDLAAIILERVTGKSFEEYLTENIFKPAGMNRTGSLPSLQGSVQTGIGYTHFADNQLTFSDSLTDNGHFGSTYLRGSSGLYSTTRDLSRFASSLFESDVLLRPETRHLLLAPQVRRGPGEAYAVGMIVDGLNDRISYGHSGGIRGGSAEFWYYPDDGLLLVVLANRRTVAGWLVRHLQEVIPY